MQTTPLFSKLWRLLRRFYGVCQMFRSINKTSEKNNKFSLDKTGEGNVVLDLTISA